MQRNGITKGGCADYHLCMSLFGPRTLLLRRAYFLENCMGLKWGALSPSVMFLELVPMAIIRVLIGTVAKSGP